MRKLKTVSIVLVAILASSCSVEDSTEMKNGERIFGNVKVVSTNHYTLTERFGREEIGEKLSRKVYLYDENINLIERQDYNKNDELISTFKYHYDGANNTLTKGEMISHDNNVENELTYTTNEYGKVLEMDLISDGTLLFKDVHKYNENGSRYETNTYMSDGTLFGTEVFTYNNEGILIETKRYGRDEMLRGHVTYKMDVFDSKGNWIQRKIYSDGEPTEVVQREIIYW